MEENILIIDDDPLVLKALEITLQTEGYKVYKASTGKAAIEAVKNFTFTVIICDLHLPDVVGIEVLKESISYQPEAARIALTGTSDLQMMTELINIGQVSHFILKPWETVSLIQTVNSCAERAKLIRENIKLQDVILEKNKELTLNHLKLVEELQIGGLIHQVMLTSKVPLKSPGLTIQALTVPSKEIDGDFYDFYQPNPHLLDVVMGDVMGKGLPAALVGTAVKAQLSRFATPNNNERKVSEKGGFWVDDTLHPSNILGKVLENVASQLIELEYFVTLVYGRFNMQTGIFSLIDCGSTKPLHFKSSEKKCNTIVGQNFPLGILSVEKYKTNEVTFAADDLFVFYSDGLTEAGINSGEMFGLQRLIKLVEDNHDKSPEEILLLIKHALINYTQQQAFEDDLTLIIVKIDKNFVKSREIKTFKGKFANDLSQLKAVRDFVSRVCLSISPEAEELVNELQLALNEIFCNIVAHGYPHKKRGEILINATEISRGITLEVLDQGESFNPTEMQDPSFVGDQDNGYGMFMVRNIASRLTYIPKKDDKDWNRLTLVKYFKNAEESMQFTHNLKNNVMTIVLEDENLDAKDAADFKSKVKELIESSSVHNILLDMHKLHFIDSSGLGSFLSILRTVNNQGGDLKMTGMTKPIRAVFELVNMHKIFEIYNTSEEALRSFKKES
jgi:anti-anti-sigma factor